MKFALLLGISAISGIVAGEQSGLVTFWIIGGIFTIAFCTRVLQILVNRNLPYGEVDI